MDDDRWCNRGSRRNDGRAQRTQRVRRTIRYHHEIFTVAQKLTTVSLIYRTVP